MKSSSIFSFLLLCIALSVTVDGNEIKMKTFSQFNGTVAAFGDFNSDKFTDIFLIKHDQRCLQIIFQLPEKTEQDAQIFFVDSKSSNLCVNNQILSIIPSDFDGDALMDVALVTKRKGDGFGLIVLKGTKKTLTQESELYVNDSGNITSQPMLLDYNGDMISDLLVAETNENGTSYYVILGGTFERHLFDRFRKDKISVRNPNSNAFIDLNSDGVADIFIEEKDEMHYYFAKDSGYADHTGSLVVRYPKDYEVIGSSAFCDINSDEIIEHLMPVCKNRLDKKSCSIMVRDQQKDEWVMLVDKIKVGDDYFYFQEATSSNGTGNIEIPIRLRHGYVNENGFTDLMALMKSEKDDKWHVVLFNNRKIQQKPNELNVTFEITALNETRNGEPILATFFDLHEDGVIDILVNYKKTIDVGHEFKVLTLNDFSDVNFVKILVISGLCTNGNCYEKGTYGEDTYLTPYGTNSPGSMVCYQLVNSNSNAMKSCGGQLSQCSNFALQMPYTIFGLGLYANYLEKLTITIPSGNTSTILQRKVEQIVPDSQIVVIPNPIQDPSAWKIKLFLTPSDIIFKTLYTLAAICVLLIVIIGVLHRKEMLEDVEEQKLFKKQWPEYRR